MSSQLTEPLSGPDMILRVIYTAFCLGANDVGGIGVVEKAHMLAQLLVRCGDQAG
jgi:hypothetical protein